MRFITQWLLVLLTVLNPILAGAALTDFDRQELAVKNWLAPYNSGFESSKAKWTASGGTLAAVTSGTNLLVGKGSATWDSGSAAQTLTSQTITIEKGYYGQNCEAGIVAQTPSGTATHTVQAYDGTNILVSATIVSSTTPRLNTVNFPCPQSGTVALRLVSVAADEPLIALDDAYLGLARNVGSTQLISEWQSYTPTGSWTSNTTYTGKWRRLGDTAEVQVRLALSGAPTAASLTVNLPSGLVIDTSKLAGGTTQVELPNSDGSMRDDASYNGFSKAFYDSTTSVGIRSPSTATAHTLVIVNSTTPITWAANDSIDVTFRVPIVGWTAQTIVMPDAQGWWAGASIVGAAASLSTSTQASFTEITNTGLTLTPTGGSATIGIACASGTTNAAGATTCAAAAESIGVTVSVPVSGAYRVCTSAANFMEDTGAATNVNALQTFKVNLTTAASSTVVTSGDATAHAALKTNSGGGGEVIGGAHPFSVCSIFQLSAGGNTFRLMYSSSISGTLAANTIDASGGVSQNVSFRIEPVSQQQQAILANSVSTSATNGEKIESLRVDASCTSSPCAIGSQSGAFTDVTRSTTGNYSVNYPASTWSAGPRCVVTAGDANTLASCKINSSATTTSVSIFCPNTSTGTGLDSDFNIICMGPR